MHTHIPSSLLEPYKDVLKSLTQWDISKQPEFWSPERIDGEMMYKIHRHSARIVEETGLSVQQILYDNHNVSDKVFPFYHQVIKVNGILNSVESDEDVFCQTFTFLNGQFENSTFVIKNKEQ